MYNNGIFQYPNQYPYGGTTIQQKQEVVRVNGKNGAEAYQMPSNSSILLLDETAPIIWLKMTDGAGYPTLTPYKIEPYIEEKTNINNVLKTLEKRILKLEEAVSNNNGKSNTSNARRKASTNSE